MFDTAQPMRLSKQDDRADEVMVPMRDGTRLATDVYLPEGAGPYSALLARVPYDKGGDIALMPHLAGMVTEQGYALVVQDVRGKARSEGAPAPFVHEVGDGFDALEWMSSQRWCRNEIGMLGDSYYGWTQWAAVAGGHPALRAIAPRVTSTHVGADWMYHGDSFCLAAMVDWAALTWVDAQLPEFDRDFSIRPLRDLIPAWRAGLRSPDLDQWSSWGSRSAAWRSGIFAKVTPERIRIPALHLGGWWDIFRRGQLADWKVARSATSAPQYLAMDATDHQWEQWRATEPSSDSRVADFLLEAFLIRYVEPVLRFMDRELRGLHGGRAEPLVRYHAAGAGWGASDRWPPAGARPLTLWLCDAARAPVGPEGGTLSPQAEPGRHTVRWTHDPDELVPTLDDDVWWPLLNLEDERDVEVRDDVLTFTTSPQSEDLLIAGPLAAELKVSARHAPFQLTAKLVDVSPDGRARRVTEGVRTLSEPDEQLVRVDLADSAYLVPGGHRLRLEVAGSEFPRYAPTLAPDAAVWDALTGPQNEITLHIGERHGSLLHLSVLP